MTPTLWSHILVMISVSCSRLWLTSVSCIRLWLTPVSCIRLWLTSVSCIRLSLTTVSCIRLWLTPVSCILLTLTSVSCIRLWLTPVSCIHLSQYRWYFLFRTIRVEYSFVTSLMMLRKAWDRWDICDRLVASLSGQNRRALEPEKYMYDRYKMRMCH